MSSEARRFGGVSGLSLLHLEVCDGLQKKTRVSEF